MLMCVSDSSDFPESFVSRPVHAESCGPSPCINLEVVRKLGTILYCDYVMRVTCLNYPHSLLA